MKHALSTSLLVTFLAVGAAQAQSRRPIPQGCKEDFGDCKENCTIEYGSSTRTRKQLASCLLECNEKMSMCRERHYTVQESGLAPGSLDTPREPESAVVEHSRGYRSEEEAPTSESSGSAGPEPSSEGTVRSGVYRASQTPDSGKRPVAEPAEEDDSEASLELPPPPPPRSEVKPAKGTPPPEEEETELAAPRAKPATEEKPVATAPEADDEEPPPPPRPPAPKPRPVAEPERPKPPPEPKKDISEWDPDAED